MESTVQMDAELQMKVLMILQNIDLKLGNRNEVAHIIKKKKLGKCYNSTQLIMAQVNMCGKN